MQEFVGCSLQRSYLLQIEFALTALTPLFYILDENPYCTNRVIALWDIGEINIAA